MDATPEPAKSSDDVNARLERLIEASRTDAKLRQAVLHDAAAVLVANGVPLAPGLHIRFVESDPSEIVIPLPPYEGSA